MNDSQPRVRRISLHDVSESDLSRFPDFLVISPPETGTEWLHANLSAHPQVFLPQSTENKFIADLGTKRRSPFVQPSFRQYLEHLQDTPGRFAKKTFEALRRFGTVYRPQIIGDMSESYASLSREVVEEIAMLNSGLKAILILRDPVDRAVASAEKVFARKFGVSLNQIPDSELGVFLRSDYEGQSMLYSELIERWQGQLGSGNVFLGQFEALCRAPAQLLGEIHQFLGVETRDRYCAENSRTQLEALNQSKVSGSARRVAAQVLEEQVADYRQLLKLLDQDRGSLALSS